MYDTTYRLPTASFGNDLPPTPKWYRIPFQISNFIHPPTLLVSDTISNFTFYTPHPPNLVRFEELFSKNCILFVKVAFFCEKWYNFHCKNDNFLVKNGWLFQEIFLIFFVKNNFYFCKKNGKFLAKNLTF